MKLTTVPFRDLKLLRPDIEMTEGKRGVLYLRSREPLESRPERITDRLVHWAAQRPDNIFIGQRETSGGWRRLTYEEVFTKVKRVAQYLMDQPVSVDRPVAILSGNSIEFAIVMLSALHIGIPVVSISPAYSLRSTDYAKLKHCIELITPGLIFVQDGQMFETPLKYVSQGIKVLAVDQPLHDHDTLVNALSSDVTPQVDEAYHRVQSSSIAKILFTSGSTGMPKGVINTHGNLTTNCQQTLQTFPFMKEHGFHIIDWLPWHHTFGGNNNFGMALYCGGSIHIDDGAPTPDGIEKTIRNLKEIAPTIFYNVPKGYEELLPYLQSDQELAAHLFSRLCKFFYAGASLSQHVWDGYEQLAADTIGKRIFMATALGMTEASPSAIFSTKMGMRPGDLGVPVPGLSVKLVPVAGKVEARFKGDNLTPGYWRNAEATTDAFDEEGYYKTGDAVVLLDPKDPNQGLVFDGRIAEDFKLNTGAWVSVGALRGKIVKASNGLIRDAVIAGHDKSYLSAILIPDEHACMALVDGDESMSLSEVMSHPKVVDSTQLIINILGAQSTGSSTCIRRAMIADFPLSIDKGEVTDKGTINQSAFLQSRKALIEKLYDETISDGIFSYKP